MAGKKWTPEQRAKYKRTLRRKRLSEIHETKLMTSKMHDDKQPTQKPRKASERIKDMTHEIYELTEARNIAAERLEVEAKQTAAYFPAAWNAMMNLFDSMSPRNKRNLIQEFINRV